MLLIIGIPSESPVRLLTEACEQLDVPYKLFNQRMHQYWSVNIDYSNYDNTIISDGEQNFRIGDFTGIYLRVMDHTQVPEYLISENKKSIDEVYTKLFKVLDCLEKPHVANKPAPMASNNSKPYQAQVIRKFGLQIPDTTITNDAEEAAAFISKYNSAIYKSISGTRSIVKHIDENALKRLNKILYCPVQFQECVTGTNVRVHVVNETAIATKINSDAVDYRYAHTENKHAELESFTLNPLIADKCIQLSKALELSFTGIDLMLTDDGRTICFEVNPSPGYSYYEANTGQLISHALAYYLSSA